MFLLTVSLHSSPESEVCLSSVLLFSDRKEHIFLNYITFVKETE